VIVAKYGSGWGGWSSLSMRLPHGVALWRGIMNGWEIFVQFIQLRVGNGRRVKFWEHVWCGDKSLRDAFPSIYHLACDREASVSEYLQIVEGHIVWDIRLWREVLDREMETLMDLLSRVYGFHKIGEGEDEICWKLSKKREFQVKSYYQALCGGGRPVFPWKAI
jgi:hypothetical protein